MFTPCRITTRPRASVTHRPAWPSGARGWEAAGAARANTSPETRQVTRNLPNTVADHASAGAAARQLTRDALLRGQRASDSHLAVGGDGEGVTDFAHPGVGEPAEPMDEHGERHALNGIQVDRRTGGDRILAGLQDNL